MPKFMLLLHEAAGEFAALSPTEMQAVFERYNAWGKALADKGAMRGGEKLGDEHGRWLKRGPKGVQISDGPFNESKEIIGGYFAIEADDYDTAVALAQDCPHLDHGWIEVRRVDAT